MGLEGISRLPADPAPGLEHPVIFWGCGGQALVLLDILGQGAGMLAHVISDAGESEFCGVPVSSWQEFRDARAAVPDEPSFFAVAIGGERGEYRLERFGWLVALGLKPLTLVHASATLLSQATVGQACQILARAVVGVGARLGNAVIVNTGAIVDHEVVVGDGCHLAPGSVLLGRVTLGERVFVGANATVLPGRKICRDVIIGAGAVVTGDIDLPGTYVGAPARRLPIR